MTGAKANRHIGERGNFKRARKTLPVPYHTLTDGRGGILDRPVTKGLDCFADPVEYLLGLHDQPTKWGDKDPQPKGCALCPVKRHCHKTAWERIDTSSELQTLHEHWERETASLPQDARYRHSTWGSLVTACEEHSWPDCNDSALIQDAEKRSRDKQLRRAARGPANRRSKKGPKQVRRDIAAKIAEYREERVLELTVAKMAPSPPLWLRNRSFERSKLIADAWEGRELLREADAPASGRAVADWLETQGRKPAGEGDRFVKAVEEALRRADQLIDNRIWPEFEPRQASSGQPGHGMHSAAILKVLDD